MTGAAHPQEVGAALAPVRIVELGQRIGASVCGTLLSQLGADVIAVETAAGTQKAAFRRQMSAGKKLWRLHGGPAEEALIHRLLASADVVIRSSDCDEICWSEAADQIVCDITACGSSGSLSGRALTDTEVQALTGILHTTGLPEGQPVPCPVPIIEYMAGINAAAAVIAALRVRRLAGSAQAVEVALYDCGFSAMSSLIARLFGPTSSGDIGRIGNRHGLSSPWNVYRAKDGWVQICTGSDEQWRRLCSVIGRPDAAEQPSFARSVARVSNNRDVDALVQTWVADNSVATCVAELAAASVAVGPIVPIQGYPHEPNLQHRRMIRREDDGSFLPGSPLCLSRTPGRVGSTIVLSSAQIERLVERDNAGAARAEASAQTPALPLTGITVVEIGHYTTAPAAARTLAALGANVIKVEPPGGEASRGWPPLDRGQSTFYTVTNSDKQSLVLDLSTEHDRQVLWELLARADVLIENQKPGALAKRGFSVQALQAANPRLVSCGISGFGACSLYPGRPAFDTVVQGMSGLMHLIRGANDTPLKTGISAADVMGAAVAVVAVLAALEERCRSGRGQAIDLSMQDIMAWVTETAWNDASLPAVGRVMPADDGAILVVTQPVGVRSAERAGREAACRAISESGGRAVPIVTPAEMLVAEHTRARALHCLLADERGEWPAIAIPFRMSRTPPRVTRPSPALGRDTDRILKDLAEQAVGGRDGGSRAVSCAAEHCGEQVT